MNPSALAAARRRRLASIATFTAAQFPEQREFYRPRKKILGGETTGLLRAALCSRRAGKTRGGNESDLELASATQDGRFLYINETRAECKRLAWMGARGDGMMSLARDHKLDVRINETELTIYFPKINSLISLIGVDDEAAIRKALGTPWNRVRWDEAQRIPTKFNQTILETLLPALLDYGGEFLMTGTPERKMSGLFYDVTRTDRDRRSSAWEVHRWTLMANPFWGRAKNENVVWGVKDEIVSGPHAPGEIPAAIAAARHLTGVLGLQELLGGPDVAALDSPLLRRQAMGQWVKEDSNYVYAVNRKTDADLFYASHRVRADGFVDVAAALADLPYPWQQGVFALGVDLGYNDPFALTLWGWHPTDAALYEVCAWKKSGLDSDEQNACIKAVREVVPVGLVVADAGGIGKQVTKGWSREWVSRYGLPIQEAEKQHKQTAINVMNADILAGRIKFREGSPLIAEMRELQWSTIVDGSGKLFEDPTLANDCCFVAGTMIRTEFGEQPIESLQIGDRVWTRAGLRAVTAAWCTGRLSTWQLTTESGARLTGTANHPVLTSDGWIRLDELTPDCIVTESGATNTQSPVTAPSRVLRVQPTGEEALVYNLTVDGEHEYFANGVLVHNCDSALYSHRHSYHFRGRPEEQMPAVGTPARYAREAAELEEAMDDMEDDRLSRFRRSA